MPIRVGVKKGIQLSIFHLNNLNKFLEECHLKYMEIESQKSLMKLDIFHRWHS